LKIQDNVYDFEEYRKSKLTLHERAVEAFEEKIAEESRKADERIEVLK